MTQQGIVLLQFKPELNDLGDGKKLTDGLSSILQVGDSLWVANDESVSLERLSFSSQAMTATPPCATDHKQFLLRDYLTLPVPASADPTQIDEIDVEGLDCADGFMWLVGSHSLKRKNPALDRGVETAHKHLAKISADGNRYLLARVPVTHPDKMPALVKKTMRKGQKCIAAQLHGDADGNDLTKALKDDPHLGPFLSIPGKDNGFDIEGLAVSGKRLFLGLRGPVLRGWAVILEIEPVAQKTRPATLKLSAIGADKAPYRKHFLDLGGLGIRDLCVQGPDLLILTGPTMDLDGPVIVYRWLGGAAPRSAAMVTADSLQRVLDVPFRDGADHAEGMTLLTQDGGKTHALLVVYDSSAVSRNVGNGMTVADLFALPAPAKARRGAV